MSDQPIVISQVIDAPVSRVWKAITDRDEMKEWYFDIAEFKAEPGYKFQFESGPEGGMQYLHICEVKEVVPEKMLSYSWRYSVLENGDSMVRFELIPSENATEVKLSHEGVATFSEGGEEFVRENFVNGWTHLISDALKKHCEKTN